MDSDGILRDSNEGQACDGRTNGVITRVKFPPLPRHLKSQSIPSATHKPRASPLITNTSRAKRLCTSTPSQTHRAAWNRPRWYSTPGTWKPTQFAHQTDCMLSLASKHHIYVQHISSFERNRPLWTMQDVADCQCSWQLYYMFATNQQSGHFITCNEFSASI